MCKKVESIKWATNLQTATAATTLATSRIGRDGRDVFDTTDFQASTGKSAERGLGARSGSLGAYFQNLKNKKIA